MRRQISRCSYQYVRRQFRRLFPQQGVLIEAGFDTLNGMKVPVFPQKQMAHCRHQRFRRTTAAQILRGDRTRLIDLLLQIEQRFQFAQKRLIMMA